VGAYAKGSFPPENAVIVDIIKILPFIKEENTD
jgi:hypothetical protein